MVITKVVKELVFMKADHFGLTRGLPMHCIVEMTYEDGSEEVMRREYLGFEPVQKITPNEFYEYEELRFLVSKLFPTDPNLDNGLPICELEVNITTDGEYFSQGIKIDTINWPYCILQFNYKIKPVTEETKHHMEGYTRIDRDLFNTVGGMLNSFRIVGRLQILVDNLRRSKEAVTLDGEFVNFDELVTLHRGK